MIHMRTQWKFDVDRLEETGRSYAKTKKKEVAQKAQREWRKKFKRRAPKSPKENRRDLEMFDENRNPLGMTVKEFIKAVKKKKSVHRFSGLEIGVLGRKKLDAERRRAFEQQDLNRRKEFGGEKITKKARSLESARDWTKYALATETTRLEKKPNSSAGGYPFTWKNPERGRAGSARRNYPDYYLYSQIRAKEDSSGNWLVYISPYFSGDRTRNIYRVLEEGGSVYKKYRIFLGYIVHYYRLTATVGDRRGRAPGAKYGQNRRKIKPIYKNVVQSVSVAARPFIAPMAEEIKKYKL